ncbi:sporulation histidine kinase inhibitor Sda [Alkalicoccobacillus murimartini]|uniref:Developmental checkpoint coupling sporulation initiation to replication initiation n=1 Tax=Alkalicoccobacillus murimartini TaxID=171685 RepID=A0ABT9YMJ0_9BACI|nr:sporulation histidine kinase inhibitor Sda [Alkalicoccobacillus murimartini]MDQ0208214.1 developmental checkpoint coupling sporulation initiation to replication initiation [Alkalicoccobacillus murimartini]
MKNLNNEMLVEAFVKAKELSLSEDFIMLLHQELEQRNLQHKLDSHFAASTT